MIVQDKQPRLEVASRAVLVRALSLALILALIGASITAPLTAWATSEGAEAGNAMTSEITPFEAMTLTIRRLPNTYFAAVTGFLDPDTTELPVTVEIAVPAGAAIIWFGEPFEGPIVDAPFFEPPYNVRTEGNFDIYTATLENHPQVQIEFNLFETPVVALGDGTYMLSMEYTPLTDLMAFRFITNLPVGSENLTENFEFMAINTERENEYGHTFRDVRAGQPIVTSITYSAVGGMGTPNEPRVSDGLLITAAVIAVGVAMALTLVIVTRRRKLAAGEYDEEWEDE